MSHSRPLVALTGMRTIAAAKLLLTTSALAVAACSGRLTVLSEGDAGTSGPDAGGSGGSAASGGADGTTTGSAGGTGGSAAGGAGGASGGTGGSAAGGAGGASGGTGGSAAGGAGGASGGTGGWAAGGAGGASGGTSGGTGGVATGGSGGASGGGGGATGGSGGMGPGGAGGAGGSAGTFCLGQQQDTKVLPMDLYVVADASSSMECPIGVPNSTCVEGAIGPYGPRWVALGDAVSQVSKFLASRGAAMGIGFAPQIRSNAVSCAVEDYTPTVPLPGSYDDLVRAVTQPQTRTGGSILAIGLDGALGYTVQYAKNHPDRRAAVAMLYDGPPAASCTATDTLSRAMKVAGTAYHGLPSIRTTAIGIGLELGDLEKIAIDGGSIHARLVDAKAGLGEMSMGLATAFREAATPCEFAISMIAPPPYDVTKLNVAIYLSNFGHQRAQSRVLSGAAECGQWEGWYYDDAAAPTKVVLCPATCNALAADDGPTLSTITGCPTVIRPPPP